MADSAIDWEVIIVANGCVYRENVFDEKRFFYNSKGSESGTQKFNRPYMTIEDI